MLAFPKDLTEADCCGSLRRVDVWEWTFGTFGDSHKVKLTKSNSAETIETKRCQTGRNGVRFVVVPKRQFATSQPSCATYSYASNHSSSIEPRRRNDSRVIFINYEYEYTLNFTKSTTRSQLLTILFCFLTAVVSDSVSVGNFVLAPKETRFASKDPLVTGIANQIESRFPGLVVGVNVPIRDAAGEMVTGKSGDIQENLGTGTNVIFQNNILLDFLVCLGPA